MGSRRSLIAYLREIKDTQFQWGVHDCLTFTNEAWRRMNGDGWADDWLSRYMINGKPIGRDAMREEFGFNTLEEAISDRLTPISCVPPVGALITTDKARKWLTGVAMGISTGRRGVFLNTKGVIYMPLTDIKDAWI